jgi:hypothetical protein
MRPESDPTAAALVSSEPGLDALLSRLQTFALEPGFRVQRQIALMRALQPYVTVDVAEALSPRPEELRLAELCVYADFLPEDGQLSLVEQVRDTVTTHIPQEERVWLDPVRHSYMDLFDIVALDDGRRPSGPSELILRSLGDGHEYRVAGGDFSRGRRKGQILLTRLIRSEDRAVVPGVALAMSSSVGQAVWDLVNRSRRQMEVETGTFALGEWAEFAKQHGHVLMWKVAEARMGLLLGADARVRFRGGDGQPFLYAAAVYDHHDFKVITDGMSALAGCEAEGPDAAARASARCRSWVRRDGDSDRAGTPVVARLTLTPLQLLVECEDAERLNELKHELAATFGFALHFRGETAAVPEHDLVEVDLLADELPSRTVDVSSEQGYRVLRGLFESVFLDWAERPCPALGGRSPRQVAHSTADRPKVAAVIDELERHDPMLLRTGHQGYDYSRIRRQLGLE